jgi:hypothetical protein
LSIISSASFEYVLLVSDTGFDTTLPHLLVMSPQLVKQNSYSMDDIVAGNPPGRSFVGTTALAHFPDGRIVIGNLQTNPTASGLDLYQKLDPAVVTPYGWTIEGPPSTYLTWSDFILDYSTQQLSYNEYAANWSTRTPKGHPVSSAGAAKYNLAGVFSNPEDSFNNTAIMVFSGTGSDGLHFITVPKNPDFFNQFLPGPPLMENTAYTDTQIVKNNLDSSTIRATSDGIVAYDFSVQSLVWFTFADPSTEKALRMPEPSGDLQFEFSFSGGYYCTWDPVTRILTRYEKWW